MKALVKTQKGDGYIEVQQKPYPTLRGEDWVIIKVKAAGVCGTDLHIWHDMYPYWPPVILGHEFSGEVAALGKNVTHLSVGDRVSGVPLIPCMKCSDPVHTNLIQSERSKLYVSSRKTAVSPRRGGAA